MFRVWLLLTELALISGIKFAQGIIFAHCLQCTTAIKNINVDSGVCLSIVCEEYAQWQDLCRSWLRRHHQSFAMRICLPFAPGTSEKGIIVVICELVSLYILLSCEGRMWMILAVQFIDVIRLSVLLPVLLIYAVFPCPQSVSSTSLWGGCMSRCFSDHSGYFCRYWGSKAVQAKTDKSADRYMLCVLPATTTEGSIIGSVSENDLNAVEYIQIC